MQLIPSSIVFENGGVDIEAGSEVFGNGLVGDHHDHSWSGLFVGGFPFELAALVFCTVSGLCQLCRWREFRGLKEWDWWMGMAEYLY